MSDPSQQSSSPEPDPSPEVEELVAYLDGEVDDETAQAIESRLSLDPHTRAEADTLKRTWDLLDYLPRPEPSPTFTTRTLEKIAPIVVRSDPLGASSGGFSGNRLRAGTTLVFVEPPLPAWRIALTGMGWVAAVVLAVVAGYQGHAWLAPRTPVVAVVKNEGRDVDAQFLSDLRVIEHLRLYQPIVDLEYARSLDHPDLFGEER